MKELQEKQGIIRKIENTETNRTLFEMAQQLAYNEEKIEGIATEVTNDNEILQEEMIELGIYLANDYLNQDRPQDISPLQDKRDYFNENIENITKSYYKNTLEPIQYKPETAQSSIEEALYEKSNNLRVIMTKDDEIKEEVLSKFNDMIKSFDDEEEQITMI